MMGAKTEHHDVNCGKCGSFLVKHPDIPRPSAKPLPVRTIPQVTLERMDTDLLDTQLDRMHRERNGRIPERERHNTAALRLSLRRTLLDTVTIAPLNDWQTGLERLPAGTQLTHEILLTLSIREMGYLPLPPGARERVIDILARDAAKQRRLAGRKLKY